MYTYIDTWAWRKWDGIPHRRGEWPHVDLLEGPWMGRMPNVEFSFLKKIKSHKFVAS